MELIVETPERKWKVYKLTSPSGKSYVGITSQRPEDRWHNGKGYRKNDHLMRAIKKYGWDNFTHEILYDNLSHEEAVSQEKRLISELNLIDANYGYNKS